MAATVTPVALIIHLILSRNLIIVDDAGIIGMILVPILYSHLRTMVQNMR